METRTDSILTAINRSLQDGWQAKLTKEERLYYLDHNSKTSHWIPTLTCCSPEAKLPHGWEEAVDKNGKHYYINHVSCTTTREDPFDVEDIPPAEREVTLQRDPIMGFGFIAGSEKPVVVRSVTEGGPSVGKLLPGDMILRLNGGDVTMKDGTYIIEGIRQSSETIRLSVIQPHIDKTGLKSSFLSATKKHKLKTKPSKVHFADNVKVPAINPGKPSPSLLYLPSVLKVYLENGQTKSFKYDNKTTVKDVLRSLREKMVLHNIEYFSLVVQNIEKSPSSKFTILREDETLTQIANKPCSKYLKCLLRVTFAPRDAIDLLSKDAKAFEYFYLQCYNDVINERFSMEIETDKAACLAALHIQQQVLASKQLFKISLKALEREHGLETFFPASFAKKLKPKEMRRYVNQYLKQNQCLCTPGQKHLTELQAKLHYLKILCDLRSYGGMFFDGTMMTHSESGRLVDYYCTVLVGPRYGITEIISMATSLLADFSQLTEIQMSPLPVEDDCLRVEIGVRNEQPIVLLLSRDDAYNMVTLVNGYYRLFVDSNRSLVPNHHYYSTETEAPVYKGKHRVIASEWNYPVDVSSEIIHCSSENEDVHMGTVWWGNTRMEKGDHIVDLSTGPPVYQDDVQYINRLKSQGRFHPLEAAGGQPNRSDLSYSAIQEETEDEEEIGGPYLTASDVIADTTLDETKRAYMIDDVFNGIQSPGCNSKHTTSEPTENRLEMKIDGSDESSVYSEVVNGATACDKISPQGKSLTEHFHVSDDVAMVSPTNKCKTPKGQVKLLHYTVYNDDSLVPVGEISSEADFDNEVESRSEDDTSPGSSNTSKGSAMLASEQTKANDEITYSHDEKTLSYLLSYSSSSMDSDIVDLTQAVPTSSADSPSGRERTEISSPGLADVNTSNLALIGMATGSPVPVSVIDLPSSLVVESFQEVHELDAVETVDVNLDCCDRPLEREVHGQDPECGSDSGNETISSETNDNGASDVSSLGHSSSDYSSMISVQQVSPKHDLTPTLDTPDESLDNTLPLNSSSLGSDTDSVSTLGGSSQNLSDPESTEKPSDSPISRDVGLQEGCIDDLIAALIISPPPLVKSDDLDKELLRTVIPPPPVSDFDFGAVDDARFTSEPCGVLDIVDSRQDSCQDDCEKLAEFSESSLPRHHSPQPPNRVQSLTQGVSAEKGDLTSTTVIPLEERTKAMTVVMIPSQDSGFCQSCPGVVSHVVTTEYEMKAEDANMQERHDSLGNFPASPEEVREDHTDAVDGEEFDAKTSKSLTESQPGCLAHASVESESKTKSSSAFPPEPGSQSNVSRQVSVGSLAGWDFDASCLYAEKGVMRPNPRIKPVTVSPTFPTPPPRKKYSPGFSRKAVQTDREEEETHIIIKRSISLKDCSKSVSPGEGNGGQLMRGAEDEVMKMKRSSSFVCSRNTIDTNLSLKNKEHTGKYLPVSGPTLSDVQFRDETERTCHIPQSNAHPDGNSPDFRKPARKGLPTPPPKPARLKKSLTPSAKEKNLNVNTISSSNPSTLAKLLSPTRRMAFLHGSKLFSKSSSDANGLASPKQSKKPHPLRAFHSLSRKDSYDVSMFDQENDNEPTFRDSKLLRTVGGLQRPNSLELDSSLQDACLKHRPASLQNRKSVSGEPVSHHQPLRQSQSLGRATGRLVSPPKSPQKFPSPGSINASFPKRSPPARPTKPPASPRPNKPPASPRTALDPSSSSSSLEDLFSPVPLPSPGSDKSADTDTSPPPLPISPPPLKSRLRALPEHFIPPSPSKSKSTTATSSVDVESKNYGVASAPEALRDIQMLVGELETCMQTKVTPFDCSHFLSFKESLVSDVREFTTNMKVLVSTVGQPEEQLAKCINGSMHTVARLFSTAQKLMRIMVSKLQVVNLGNKVKEVAISFSRTLSAATETRWKGLHDPEMQQLLRHAQIMAAVLSDLMRVLRVIQS